VRADRIRSMSTPLFVVSILLLVSFFGVAQTPQDGGTLSGMFYVLGTVEVMMPWQGGGDKISWPLWLPLAQYKWDYSEIVPALASSCESNESRTAWTFHINPDAKWHDRVSVTSEDVKFSYMMMLNPDVPAFRAATIGNIQGAAEYMAGEAAGVSGIVLLDDHTVQFQLTEPDAHFLRTATYLLIVPSHLLGDVPATEFATHRFWENPVGSGPFKFSELIPDHYIEFVRFDEYFRGRPYIEKIRMEIMPDSSTRVLALENGEIQVTRVPDDKVDYVASLQGISILSETAPRIRGISFNVHKEEFRDPLVRLAFMKAIDIETIVESILEGKARYTESMIPLKGWESKAIRPWGYEPDEARRMLESAGWDWSREVEIQTYYTSEAEINIVTAVATYLQAIGVRAFARPVDTPTHVNEVYKNHTFDIYFGGDTIGPDPYESRTTVLSSLMYPDGWNFGFSDYAIDTLYAKANATLDTEALRQVYDAIQVVLHEHVIGIATMYQPEIYWGVSNTVHDFNPHAGEEWLYFGIEKTWIEH